MSYAASVALQGAVYQRLRADAVLSELVGDAIYDAMPVDAPSGVFVSLGPEEVRDAGNAGALVDAADARHPSAGDGRRVVPLDHEQFHAVGERALLDRDLLRLARCQAGQGDRQAKRLAKRPAAGTLNTCFRVHC